MTTARRVRLRPRGPFGWIVLALLLAGLIWLGQLAWHGRQLLVHAQALRAELAARPLTSARAESLCIHGQAAADALGAVDRDLRLVRLVLPALGWVPRYGLVLAQAPALLDAGLAGGAAGRAMCHGFTPLFPLIDAHQQGVEGEVLLARALPLIEQAQPDLEKVANALARLEAALARVDPDRLETGALAGYAPMLRSARVLLPDARAAFDTGRALLPIGVRAFQPGQTHRYLLLAQNSGELRSTGGYIGTLGTVLVSDGHISMESFHDAFEFNMVAPPTIEMPVSYVRYLRIVGWYLRDANWHTDFPTTVRNLEYFWRLNKRPPLDGVIGIDLYAFQQFFAALGPLEVAGYGTMRPENSLEPLFQLYQNRDKRLIGALLDAALQRLRELTPDQALALGRTAERVLRERHILLALNDPQARDLLRERQWDGALVKPQGDYLMVVSADFSYSEVNLFIDSRIAYSVTLASDLRPLTSTVTLQDSNGFDLWKQGHTGELIGGFCPLGFASNGYYRGCYGNFVRVYAPPGATWLSGTGLDGHPEYALEQGHAMFGNYMYLVPGELRTATMSYRPEVPASDGVYRLYVQKQSGTVARPFHLEVRTTTGYTLTLDTDLWVDRELVIGWRDGRLALLSDPGPLHPSNTPERLAPRRAFLAGWQRWQAGERDAALAIWRDGRALDYVIDRANALTVTGRTEQARAVAAAAIELDPTSARAVFALAQALSIAGDLQQSLQVYERALELDPQNKQTRIEIDLLRQRLGL